MIKSVTIINYLGDAIYLPLSDPDPDSGLFIVGIEGLGPVKANINTTSLSTSDGSIYNSARLNERNIVLDLLFDFKPKIEDARQLTYKYFPIKKNLTFIIETDNRTLMTTGYVEANEPNIFAEREGCQISIICPDPYFYSLDDGGINRTSFSAIEDLFEFEFSNESLTDDLIIFGNIVEIRERLIEYYGDSEIGVIMTINVNGSAKNITLYSVNQGERMFIDTDKLEQLTGEPLGASDAIIISTVKGEKYALLQRDGVRTNILNCIGANSEWFQLSKGDNIFAYSAEEGVENLLIEITNQVIYEGV